MFDKSQIPLHYLIRSWFEAGRGPVCDQLRAGSSRHVEIARTCSKLVADRFEAKFSMVATC